MPIRRSSMIDRTAPLRTALLAPLCLASASPAPARDPQLWVSNEVSNTISVIAPRSNAVTATITVGRRPRGMALSPDRRTVYVAPDGRRAYVTAEAGGNVTILDVATDSVLGQFPIRDGKTKPVRIAFASDGRRAYVTEGAAGTVSVVDLATRQVIDTIPVGKRPWGIALSPDAHRLYTADGRSNQVSVIDTDTRQVVATIPVGDRPNDLLYVP